MSDVQQSRLATELSEAHPCHYTVQYVFVNLIRVSIYTLMHGFFLYIYSSAVGLLLLVHNAKHSPGIIISL